MKLKCVGSSHYDRFVIGDEYNVLSQDGRFYEIRDKDGFVTEVTLDGAIWQFEIVQEDDQDMQQKSGPKFGDIVHVDGEEAIYWYGLNQFHYIVKESKTNPVCVELHEIDEYKPDPEQELRQRILNDWCSQSLDLAFDTEICQVDCSVREMIDFIVKYKDKW